ncbi:hypothetical protein IJH97_02535 [Candidatus Saccharibacteria bacterium]|nr:hypothetical protein [Candidatus Saccharibacteria bacterium]
MQIITILLGIAAALAVTAGFLILLGARKGAKNRAFLAFCLILCFTAVVFYLFGVVYERLGLANVQWMGPIILCLAIALLYYAILHRKIIALKTSWLRFLSYVVIMFSLAVVYAVILHLVIYFIFKIKSPPTEVAVLNFIMISIVMILLPIAYELSGRVRSIIQADQVDMTSLIRKINKMAPENTKRPELARFVAERMHFSYVGLVIKDRLYGSKQLKLPEKEVHRVMKLGKPEDGVWQKYNLDVQAMLRKHEIYAVAALRDAKGHVFGQMLVGRPLGKMDFERQDLIQLEMVVNLIAALIDTGAR